MRTIEVDGKELNVVAYFMRVPEWASAQVQELVDRYRFQPNVKLNPIHWNIPMFNYARSTKWNTGENIFEEDQGLVHSRGGMTVVNFFDGNNCVAVGSAYCSLRDTFCYKQGVNIALQRATHQYIHRNDLPF